MPGTVIRLVSLFSTINISKGHDIQSSQEDTLGAINSNQSGINRRHVGPQQQQGQPRHQQWHPNGRPHRRPHGPYGQHQGEQRWNGQQGHPQGNPRPRRRRTSQAARVQANRRIPAHLNQHAAQHTAQSPVYDNIPSAEQPPSYNQAMGGLGLWDILRAECQNVNYGECGIDPLNIASLLSMQNLHGFQDEQARPQIHQEGQCGHGEDHRQGPVQRHDRREHGDGQPRRVQDRLGTRRQDGQHVGGQDATAGAIPGEAGAAAQRPGQGGQQGATSPRRGGPSRRRRRERRARLRAAAAGSTTTGSSPSSPPPRTPRDPSPRPDSADPGGPQNAVLELDESLLRDLEELFPERGGGGTDAETPEERERGILTLRAEADGAESRTRRDQGWR